jgi:hypothetical protein
MDTPYENLLANLGRVEVKLIIVGGVAVALNGFVRTTEDVDILIDSSAENVTRLLNESRNFGQGHARKLSPADFSESEGAVRIIEDFPLDVFTLMRGKRYADLVGSTKPTRIDDVDAILSPKHSLRSKATRSGTKIASTCQPCGRCRIDQARKHPVNRVILDRDLNSSVDYFAFCASPAIGTKRTGKVTLSFS